MSMVFRQDHIFFFSQSGEVIRVKIDEEASGFQDPEPLPISFCHMGKRPCQVPGHYCIKTLLRKIRFFRVHDLKTHIEPECRGHVPGVRDHVRCEINAGDPMPLSRQNTGKKSRAGPDIQDSESPSVRQILPEFRQPSSPFFTFIFPQALGLKPLRPQRPVAGDPILDLISDVISLFHSLFVHSLFSPFSILCTTFFAQYSLYIILCTTPLSPGFSSGL